MQLPNFPRRRLIGAAVLACAAALIPAAVSATARHAHPVIAYVLIEPICPGGSVTPINTATNKALKPIKVPPGVTAIAITPNAKTVYVSSGQSTGPGTNCDGPPVPANTVTPISTATRRPGKPIYVGKGPGAIAITPNGATAYVLTARGVVPIRTATDKRGKAIKVGHCPGQIAITPNGKTAYVANQGCGYPGDPGTVTPINTVTNKALKAITVGSTADFIAITPSGKTAYVVSETPHFLGTVIPISTATNKAGKAIKVGDNPGPIMITPDSATAYVLTSAGVVPIRTAANTAVKAIKGTRGASAIAITPSGRTAYVTGAVTFAGGYSRMAVTVIRTATNTISKVIKIKSKQPIQISGIGITPNGRTAYLLNVLFEPGAPYGTVIPLRTATSTVGKPITVAPGPAAIVFTR